MPNLPEDMLYCLADVLLPLQPVAGAADEWLWVSDKTAQYTVKSAYILLLLRCLEMFLTDEKTQILQHLWWTAAPSKFLVHALRVLLDRLPTRLIGATKPRCS